MILFIGCKQSVKKSLRSKINREEILWEMHRMKVYDMYIMYSFKTVDVATLIAGLATLDGFWSFKVYVEKFKKIWKSSYWVLKRVSVFTCERTMHTQARALAYNTKSKQKNKRRTRNAHSKCVKLFQRYSLWIEIVS